MSNPSFVNRRSDTPIRSLRLGPLTAVLIGISAAVAVFSDLGNNAGFLEKLFIARTESEGFLPEVLHGQVWRLITPIFIHFSILHIVFNMLWLKDLGTMIERKVSSQMLLALVTVIGVLSNVGQFLYSGPIFGGMSGVVYGLLGFVWMKSRFDPASGLYVSRETVVWMLGWFVLCLTGLAGSVANMAHGTGLVVGIVWGFASSQSRET
jgi:GlpG protein